MAKSKINTQSAQEVLENTQNKQINAQENQNEPTPETPEKKSSIDNTDSKTESSQNAQNPSNEQGTRAFNEKLQNALESNASWREQVRLTLLSIAEVYNAFIVLDESYQIGLKDTQNALDSLTSQTQRVDSLASQIATSIIQAKKDFATMQERANEAINLANQTIESTTQNAKITNDNVQASEAIYDKVREMGNQIIEKEDTIIEAYEKWKALDSMLRQANALKAELDSKLEAHRSQLNADKEGYETELNQKKDEISRTLEALANGKTEALNALSETKNNALSEKIEELHTTIEQHKTDIKNAKNELATSYDNIKESVLTELKTYIDGKLNPSQENAESSGNS